ncbi:duplicated orphan permease [Aquiflexum balticum DSM 16537]|uniref:Duplicated orphan permease n=1 Tax=Aquiflexum balticum DSM 16537 TaxID=758820 RepID=A0A1W2H9V8_9BACT|nr:ABC transporter permease [Aquiflexum balticum]SMD45346.1 duplicated orphan permease [Aquiflexum balticum DSM 16537]
MLTNYLKIAFRNFKKHRMTFGINLLGLTLGLTTVILIMMWVKDELSVNRYHDLGDRIYAVFTNHDNSTGMVTIGITPAEMAEAMRTELSQVEKAIAYSPFIEDVSFESEGDVQLADGLFVDQEYLDVFNVEFLAGDKSQALNDINSVVLSETTAKNIFGSSKEALGKTLKWSVFEFGNDVIVSGVYRDFGSLDVDKPEFLLSFSFFKNMLGDGAHWDNFNAGTFLLLREGTDVDAFNSQIKDFIKDRKTESNVTPFVQAFEDTYLYGTFENGKVVGGRINYVWIFSGIALFILLIACINFMNLTTARTINRVKEIGVKKSMGASRAGLFTQFMVETLLLTFLALVTALICAKLLQPFFNQVSMKDLKMDVDLSLMLMLTAVWIVTGLMAGIYPAVYLSKFKPVQILKSNIKGSFGELLARKGLVVFQFSISLLLIIGILVIGRQMSFIQNQNLGYNQSNLLQVSSSSLSNAQLELFLDQVKRIQGVENASSLSHPLIGLMSSTIGLTWEGKNPDEQVKFENITVNMDLIETMEFELLAGRSFSPDFGDEKSKIILNEEAVKVIGLENPIGATVNLWGEDKEVIGVLKNFHFESLKETVKPAFLKYDNTFMQKVILRIEGENQVETIASISELFEGLLAQKMDYSFMDQDFQTLYLQEQRVSKLARYFGVIAVFLSCLGLFGLAAFTVENRKKEIGVRKVLGASINSILYLIVKDFVLLVLISIIVIIPLAWYLSNSWLQDYAFKINLSWGIFAGAAVIVLLIALITVSFQAFKAAINNPVNSLSSE